jgi:hypothetical protein
MVIPTCLFPSDSLTKVRRIVAYLLEARIMEPEKQSLLGNGYVTRNNGVIVGSGVFCDGLAKAIQQ